MLNTELGACEQFIYELRRSNLIERGQLDQVIDDFLKRNPRAEPNVLADHLVAQSVLTRFQADRVLAGKTQGLVLGPYVLTDSVGQGSMGMVHKALSKNDGRWYAVKVLPRRSMWNVRLARRQVRVFGQFTHASVVPFVDVGTAGGLHYLVWNFVDGESLDRKVEQRGRLDAGTTAAIALQVAVGLNLAHQNGLFHGLIKPSNISVGEDGQVRILDFGIGSLLAENEGESLVDTMSTANTLTSGLDCTSPESIMEPTNRTPAGDQYSLGCTLYYCLSGRYPFADGSAVEKMMAHQFKQAQPLTELAPETPPELVAIVEKLMAKKPEERYGELDEVVQALQPMASGRGLEALAAPVPAKAPPPGATKLSPSKHAVTPTPSTVGVSQRTPMPPLKSSSIPGLTPVKASPPPAPAPTPAQRVPPTRRAPPTPTPPVVAAAPPPAPPSRKPVPPVAKLAPATQPAATAPRGTYGNYLTTTRQDPTEPISAQVAAAEPNDPNRPMLGPVGFLAIGATVAIACYLAAQNLMK
jgi:serine/threonine-protein kinase